MVFTFMKVRVFQNLAACCLESSEGFETQPVLISSLLASNLRMLSNFPWCARTLCRADAGADADNSTSIFMRKIHKEARLV